MASKGSGVSDASIRDRARLAQRGSVSGLDALPLRDRKSQRSVAGLQALPRVADALPRRAAQRQDASTISQRTRARCECAHLGRGEASRTVCAEVRWKKFLSLPLKPWSVFSQAAIRVTLISWHTCVTSMYRRNGDVLTFVRR